jgi:hypothetical protein
MVQLSTEGDSVVVVSVHGAVDSAEILAAYERFLALHREAARVLWDLTDASLDRLPVDELRDLAGSIAARGRGRGRSAKAAVVCRSGVDFGLVRMVAALVTHLGSPVESDVFFDRAEALIWLGSGRLWPYGGSRTPTDGEADSGS